jgi:hypothetical protein
MTLMDAVEAFLREHGESHLTTIAEGVGRRPDSVWPALRRMCRRGDVECPRRGVYHLAGPPAMEERSVEQLAGSSAMEEDSIVLPRPLPDTGVPQASPFLLQEALSALTRWRAAYSGPADDSTAVSVVMASMHVQEALGVPRCDLG